MAVFGGSGMNDLPEWLPAIVSVDGMWDDVLAKLYVLFTTDFKGNQLFLNGIVVWYDRRILEGEKYEEGFWHLITKKDKQTGERLLDNRRAERLPWCRPVIECSDKPEIKIWNNREGSNKIRTYVWLENFDYVVILEKHNRKFGLIMFLITAYHLDGESSRRKMRKKYEKRL